MIKQMRVKFSGIQDDVNGGEISRDRDRKLTPQRSRSFTGEESRRGPNWYRGGQSSRELAYDYDSDYMESDEFRTAVAAAACAIIGSVDQERERARPRRPEEILTKSKMKKQEEGGRPVSMTRRATERILSFSSSSAAARNKMKNKEDDNVPISIPDFPSKRSSDLQEKMPQTANSPANTEPSSKRSSSSFDKQSGNRSPESSLASSRRQTPTRQPTFPGRMEKQPLKFQYPECRMEDRKADVWEQTEMERIQERYEKLNAKILEWENEKKEKVKKKLSRNKDKSGEKRARALQRYKTDIEIIDQIAQGARSQAEENRKKEIIKVKEKADTIRLTGKIPTKTCLCF